MSGGVRVQITAEAGIACALEQSVDLVSWTTLVDFTGAGTGQEMQARPQGAGDAVILRVLSAR